VHRALMVTERHMRTSHARLEPDIDDLAVRGCRFVKSGLDRVSMEFRAAPCHVARLSLTHHLSAPLSIVPLACDDTS
jgi:hypothetical protein